MSKRVGRYTKQETAELTRMFHEGYSVYKICRNLNRSQKSIRNNLIKLGLIDGEITPRRYKVRNNNIVASDESFSKIIISFTLYLLILLFLIMLFIINPLLNIVEIILSYIFIIIQ